MNAKHLMYSMIAVYVLANTTLYEDGAVQFFRVVGWGLCVIPWWGCQ